MRGSRSQRASKPARPAAIATYAIGDIQGCQQPLEALLSKLPFDAAEDRLWFVGDLVNRGPDSLETLRFVRGLGERAVCVLGNHDLHLLTVAGGHARAHKDDTLDGILDAPDCGELLHWLRHRPLLHAAEGYVMVHAGLLPEWTVERAANLATEVQAALQGPDHQRFLAQLYGNQPDRWDDRLVGMDRLRTIVNVLTRLRLCTDSGQMEFKHKADPADAPAGYLPWFDIPGRMSRGTPIIFGHWSALGLVLRENLVGLDTGCLWGRTLTAMRLEDRKIFQLSCAEAAT